VSPADFAGKVSGSNAFEIQEAKLALKHSKDGKVKSFARMMVKDHPAAENKLKTAAKASCAPVGAQLNADLQSKVDALNGKTGADFDKAYLADQVEAHTEAVDLQHAQSTTPAASM
jgi:putative membrane protein